MQLTNTFATLNASVTSRITFLCPVQSFLQKFGIEIFFKLSQEFPKESPIELANQLVKAKFNKCQSNYIRLSLQVFLTEILAIDFLTEIQC